MTGLFQRTYYGNTVDNWLTTFLMILGAVILGRMLYWVFSRSLKAAIQRNKLRLDDVLLDALEEPVVMLITLAAIRFIIRRLTLDPQLLSVGDGALGMAYALIAAWLITRVYDAIHTAYLKPWPTARPALSTTRSCRWCGGASGSSYGSWRLLSG